MGQNDQNDEKHAGIERKAIELLKQNTYERKNKKNTIPEALISAKERQKKEPIQRMEKFGARPKSERRGKHYAGFAERRTGHHYTNVQQDKQIATNAEEKDTTQRYVDKNIQQRNSEKTNRRRN